MHHKLPPLNALRAFEAAARHLSFTRAADELCVTLGAISRHVSILEDHVGTKLFIRSVRQVQLTPAAERFYFAIREAFAIMNDAAGQLHEQTRTDPLRISSLPTFASRWLMPRLHRFNQLHPDIMINLEVSADSINFDRTRIDLSVEASASEMANMSSDKLLDVELIPICGPRLANGMPPPTDPAELSKYPLLHSAIRPDFWPHWAQEVGVGDLSQAPSSYFPTSALVYQATKEGLGIGLGVRAFIAHDLASKEIITPLPQIVRYPAAYFLNVPLAKLRQPRVARFRNWILEEARAGTSPE